MTSRAILPKGRMRATPGVSRTASTLPVSLAGWIAQRRRRARAHPRLRRATIPFSLDDASS